MIIIQRMIYLHLREDKHPGPEAADSVSLNEAEQRINMSQTGLLSPGHTQGVVQPVPGQREDELRQRPRHPGHAERGQQEVPDYQSSSQLICCSVMVRNIKRVALKTSHARQIMFRISRDVQNAVCR